METFGKYQLKALLGSGGMGEVFLASLTSSVGVEKPCIVKRLKERLLANPNAIKRFKDEMRLLASLHHPNLVNAFDFGEEASRQYVAMELVEGLDLNEVMLPFQVKEQGLPLEFCLFILIHIARGLNYLHDPAINGQSSIIHRDLAPHNILISKNGEVKIADFGLAKSDLNEAVSSDGSIKGHLRYMPPEQARGQELGVEADIFTLGIIAYELITGKDFYPITGKAMNDSIRLIGKYRLDQHPIQQVQLKNGLKNLFLAMLHEEPSQRLSSAAEVMHCLSKEFAPHTIESIEARFVTFVRASIAANPPKARSNSNPHLSMGEALGTKPAVATQSLLPNHAATEKSPTPDAREIDLPAQILITDPPTSAEQPPINARIEALLRNSSQRSGAKHYGWWIRRLFKFGIYATLAAIMTVIGLEEGWIPENRSELKSLASKPLKLFSFSTPWSTGAQHSSLPRLHVSSNPLGARIQLNDSREVFMTPYDFAGLDANTLYRVRLQRQGYQDYDERFMLKPGEQKILVVTLKPLESRE